MREGIRINESLMYLKRLIDFLAERQKDKSENDKNTTGKAGYRVSTVGLDYRSTKLTRLLFSAFRTGRSRVILILCCSPSRDNINETNNTLEFGSNAKRIRTQLKAIQKRSAEGKYPEAFYVITKQHEEAQLDLQNKNQLIAEQRTKIGEYEMRINALNIQLTKALNPIEKYPPKQNTGKWPIDEARLPGHRITPPFAQTNHKSDDAKQRLMLEKEREERKKVEMEKEELIKQLALFEKAYGRSCETLRMQEDIIQRNVLDIMEMQNEINFFYKFKKNLKKMVIDDE